MSGELKGIWMSLREIKDELDHFDDRWEEHIKEYSQDRAVLSHLSRAVDNIEVLLTRGNGQKSVLVQLQGLQSDVAALKEDHKALKSASGFEDKSPEELRVEARRAKYIALAKIAGVISLATPGVLSLFGVGH